MKIPPLVKRRYNHNMNHKHKDYTIIYKKIKRKGSLLDNTDVTRRSASEKRKGRFWQRVNSFITRMQASRIHGYRFAFLTLTSSELSGEILHDWSIFKKRIERKFGRIWYFAVREYNERRDLVHLHLLLYAPFLPVYWMSKQWNEIHHAKVVYIEAVPEDHRKNKVLSYMAKYVAKTIPESNSGFIRRFSYSLFYHRLAECWRGFLKYYASLHEFDIKKLTTSWNVFLLANDEWNYIVLHKFIESLG